MCKILSLCEISELRNEVCSLSPVVVMETMCESPQLVSIKKVINITGAIFRGMHHLSRLILARLSLGVQLGWLWPVGWCNKVSVCQIGFTRASFSMGEAWWLVGNLLVCPYSACCLAVILLLMPYSWLPLELFLCYCIQPFWHMLCSITMVASCCWLPGMFDSLVCGLATGGIGQCF